jgi:hypothetical protein
MHAPQRSHEEIATEALELINPPFGQREATRNELLSLIQSLLGLDKVVESLRGPPAGRLKDQLQTYLKNLRAAKRTFVRNLSDDEFLTHLDAEISKTKILYDFQVSRISKGSKPRDQIAIIATGMALHLIPEQRATLTTGGVWHRLSILFYEAATGKPNCDHVLNYMAKIKSGDPRYVATDENMKRVLRKGDILRSKTYLRLKRQDDLIKYATTIRLRAERRRDQLLQTFSYKSWSAR